jgi:hypothetical protein
MKILPNKWYNNIIMLINNKEINSIETLNSKNKIENLLKKWKTIKIKKFQINQHKQINEIHLQ